MILCKTSDVILNFYDLHTIYKKINDGCVFCAAQDFQKLQQAKDILTDETKRRKYDYWLRSSITVPFSEWQALSDSVKIVSAIFK